MGYPHRRGQPISFLTTNSQSLIIHTIMAQMLAQLNNIAYICQNLKFESWNFPD